MNYTEQQIKAIKELLFKMADDELIIGHRNSEWTGLSPILEEDIAFSSIAQDKIRRLWHYTAYFTSWARNNRMNLDLAEACQISNVAILSVPQRRI
jgi:1,2-phenylacetyl-CoA epoxidase catalytic subunit